MRASVSLTRNDWSLHRKGPIDAARHNQKVKEAVRGNLDAIISEESIITAEGERVVKVPIRSLELPKFRYDYNRSGQVGQGNGESDVGDDVGQQGDQTGPGKGKQAGDEPGMDYFEAEVSIDDLAELVFQDFSLPDLVQKQSQDMESEAVRFKDVAKKGIMSNLDKRRTIYETIRRNAMRDNDPHFYGVKPDDLRFRTWATDVTRETNAVVIAMRDVSGSMGEFEKYISRSFYFWMVRFLRLKYDKVQIVFITHHTEAKEVDEDTFFKLGESGGTKVSSAYQLALDVIKSRYDPASWNIYPFHFSDGDNWGDTDNRLCVNLVEQLTSICNIFGYGEIQQGSHQSVSTLMSAFSSIKDPKFVGVTITEKAGVYPALRKFFSKREEVASIEG